MLKEDQSYTKQGKGRKHKMRKKTQQHPHRSTSTHSQRGELNTYCGFNIGPCPLLPIIKFCAGAGKAQNNWRQIGGDPSGVDGAPKFSSNRECWEGVGELEDQIPVGFSGSACEMHLMSQTKASPILPHPSPSFPSHSSGSAG